MEKLTYETPKTEIILFDEDVITTSGDGNNEIGSGSGSENDGDLMPFGNSLF